MNEQDNQKIIPPMPGMSPAGVVPPAEFPAPPSGGIEEVDDPAVPREEVAPAPADIKQDATELPVEDDHPVRVVTRPP